MGGAGRGGSHSRTTAYAAAVWAFIFAAMSFSSALGGRWSMGTQAIAIQRDIGKPSFVLVLWITGALKVLAGLVPLTFVVPAGRRIPHRLLLIAGWAVAGILLVYGGLGWLQALLWAVGATDVPAAVGARAARWKLIFWDPFWILGGCLFLGAVWDFQRRRQTVEA